MRAIVGVAVVLALACSERTRTTPEPVRIGYFHGGRVNVVWRAKINRYFEAERIGVRLYTREAAGAALRALPEGDSEAAISATRQKGFGKVSGREIVAEMMAGRLDGGTIGESSFVEAVSAGAPLVAVAMLGYNAAPGKAILLRKGLEVASPADLKGKVLISRRAGPGDGVFLREFLRTAGLDPRRDVTILDQVTEEDAHDWLVQGKIDGGLYHLLHAKELVQSGAAWVYRPMDWMDSRLSHALLVFRTDYVREHRAAVQSVVNALVKRLAYEKSLPEESRDRSWDKGLMMEGDFAGMSIPSYDLPPRLRPELLAKNQEMLLEYGQIDQRVSLAPHLDPSFVEAAMQELQRR